MRKASTLIGLTLVALGSGARAQDAPALPGPAVAAPASTPTDSSAPVAAPQSFAIVSPVPDASTGAPHPGSPRRRIEVGLSFLPMAAGKITTPIGAMEATGDALFAYGFGLSLSYQVIAGLHLGLAPQLVYNVNYKVNPSQLAPPATAQETDYLVRAAYEFLLPDGITPYVELLPGYSTLALGSGSAKGFVIDLGGGLAMEMTDRIFINIGLGYQWGFQKVSQSGMSLDNKTSYLRVALGGGVRF